MPLSQETICEIQAIFFLLPILREGPNFEQIYTHLKTKPAQITPILNTDLRDVLIRKLQEGDVVKNIAIFSRLISENPQIFKAQIDTLLQAIPKTLYQKLYFQYEKELRQGSSFLQEESLTFKGSFESWLGIPKPQRTHPIVAELVNLLHSNFLKYTTANAIKLGKQQINELEESHRQQVRTFQSSSSTQKIKKAYIDAIKHFLTHSLFTLEQQKELLAYSCREGSFASHRQWKFWSSDETQTTKNLKQWKPGSPISDDVATPGGGDIELRQITI